MPESLARQSCESTGWTGPPPDAELESCDIPSINVTGLTDTAIAARLRGRRVPVVLHGLLHGSAALGWADRQVFLDEFGPVTVRSGSGVDFGKFGPEVAVGTMASVRGEPPDGFSSTSWTLGEFAAALRDGRAGDDAYVFFNVTGGAIDLAAPRLASLWAASAAPGEWVPHSAADLAAGRHSYISRLSLGGHGSGSAFHQHDNAFSALLAGEKRWWIHRASAQPPGAGPRRPWLSRSFVERRLIRIPQHPSGVATADTMEEFRLPGAMPLPMRQWARGVFADEEFRSEWDACDACWSCTQRAGEVLFVPSKLAHATLNAGETLGLSVTNFDPSRMPVGTPFEAARQARADRAQSPDISPGPGRGTSRDHRP